MGTPESKAKWHNVAKDTLYNYHPALDKDVISTNKHISEAEDRLGMTMVQLRDDPICSSAGCTQYDHPKKKEAYKMNYFVPNFGVDQDIIDATENISNAEDTLGPWKPEQDKNGYWLVPQPIDASLYKYDPGHVDHFV